MRPVPLPPANQVEVLGQAVRFVNAIADMMRVRPPSVALGVDTAGGACGLYSPESQTITIVEMEDPARLAETLVHEFQHHLDELYGRQLGGALRGAHDRGFYRRLDGLRERVARELG